jgi:uncharacterized membrane protein
MSCEFWVSGQGPFIAFLILFAPVIIEAMLDGSFWKDEDHQ